MLEPVASWSSTPRPIRCAALFALLCLLALVAGTGPGGAVPAYAASSPTAPSGAANDAAVDDEDPLDVSITSVSPDSAVIGSDTTVTITGTVTNTSTEDWSAIRVYPLTSASPITTEERLAEAEDEGDDAFIGNRITDEGYYDESITALAPDASGSFSISLPLSALDIDGTAGVYWLGVHALGETSAGRSSNAAGKDRVFFPLLASATTTTMPTSLVVPLVQQVTYAADGSVADPEQWISLFSAGGRLRELIDLAARPDADDVTWLLDPALLDVAYHLAEGNPERSLAPPAEGTGSRGFFRTPDVPDSDADSEGTDDPSSSATATATATTSTADQPTDQPTDEDVSAADAQVAAAWLAAALDAFDALDEGQLMVLPYGDTDLSGATGTDPEIYTLARAMTTAALFRYDLSATPAVAPRGEGVSAADLTTLQQAEEQESSDPTTPEPSATTEPSATASEDTTEAEAAEEDAQGLDDAATVVLLGDNHLPADSSAAENPFHLVSGQEVVIADASATPAGAASGLQVRQRLVAAAALDTLTGATPQNKVVVLPRSWDPDGATLPVAGATGVEAVPLAEAASAPVTTTDASSVVTEVTNTGSAAAVRAVRETITTAERLDGILPDTDVVADNVALEVVPLLSYADRDDPDGIESATGATTADLEDDLALVTVEAPSGVTLTSLSGTFSITVDNGLDQPIVVSLTGEANRGVEIEAADGITVPAGGSSPALLPVKLPKLGVYDITVQVADSSGQALGDEVTVPVRSAAVGDLIWIVIGIGFVVLSAATSLWVRRRQKQDEQERKAAEASAAATEEGAEKSGEDGAHGHDAGATSGGDDRVSRGRHAAPRGRRARRERRQQQPVRPDPALERDPRLVSTPPESQPDPTTTALDLSAEEVGAAETDNTDRRGATFREGDRGSVDDTVERVLRAPRDTPGDGPGDTPADADKGGVGSKVLGSSAIMAAGTVVSRLSGYVRGILLAAALGTQLHADIFAIGNTIPNMLYILLAGGIFNAVLVPQLVRAMKHDPDGGEAYVNRIITLSALFLAVVTIALVVAAPWVMSIYLDSSYSSPELAQQRDSAIDFARYCLPQVFFYGMFVLLGQVLNSRGKFGPMMWAPIANNVISVSVLAIYLFVFGPVAQNELNSAYSTSEELLLGIGSTIGILAQLLILVPFLRAAGVRYRPRFDFIGSGLGKTFRLATWTIGFVIVNQIAYTVVVRLASAGTTESGPDTGYGTGYFVYSQAALIMMVPHAIVTVSLTTAILPKLSAAAADGDLRSVGSTVAATLRTALAFVVPTTVLVVVLSDQLALLIWGYGAARDSAGIFAPSLVAFAPAMVFFTIHYLMLRGYYALEQTRRVFFIQCAVATANIVLALLFVRLVQPFDTSVALIGAYGGAYFVGAAISYVVLSRTVGGLRTGGFLLFWLRLIPIVAISALVAAAVRTWIAPVDPTGSSTIAILGVCLAVAATFAVMVLLCSRLLRLGEVNEIVAVVTRRLRR